MQRFATLISVRAATDPDTRPSLRPYNTTPTAVRHNRVMLRRTTTRSAGLRIYIGSARLWLRGLMGLKSASQCIRADFSAGASTGENPPPGPPGLIPERRDGLRSQDAQQRSNAELPHA